MSETNGEGKSRLDRIEQIIERQELANEIAHERFEAEDKRLLTAQILMSDAIVKTNIALGKALETMDKLELKMAETTEKLDALIKVVDGIIQRPPAEGRQ